MIEIDEGYPSPYIVSLPDNHELLVDADLEELGCDETPHLFSLWEQMKETTPSLELPQNIDVVRTCFYY